MKIKHFTQHKKITSMIKYRERRKKERKKKKRCRKQQINFYTYILKNYLGFTSLKGITTSGTQYNSIMTESSHLLLHT